MFAVEVELDPLEELVLRRCVDDEVTDAVVKDDTDAPLEGRLWEEVEAVK